MMRYLGEGNQLSTRNPAVSCTPHTQSLEVIPYSTSSGPVCVLTLSCHMGFSIGGITLVLSVSDFGASQTLGFGSGMLDLYYHLDILGSTALVICSLGITGHHRVWAPCCHWGLGGSRQEPSPYGSQES